mmetsp:Transcript_126997/g.290575  ORF Transcript_126997/g.290575 Transcript_126997/m.290575 type:complete len:217 (-) Transcript_126997:1569-2219(-)
MRTTRNARITRRIGHTPAKSASAPPSVSEVLWIHKNDNAPETATISTVLKGSSMYFTNPKTQSFRATSMVNRMSKTIDCRSSSLRVSSSIPTWSYNMKNPLTVINTITSFSKNTDLMNSDRVSQLLVLIFIIFSLKVSSLESEDAVSVTPPTPEMLVPDWGDSGSSSEDSEPLKLSSSDSTSPSESANSMLGTSSCPGIFRRTFAWTTPFLAKFLT